MQAAVEGRPLPAEITKQAVQCQTLSYLWQLQQLFKVEEQPGREWTASITLFMEQLHLLLEAEDLQVKATAVRAVADLLLIFRPATFQASSVKPFHVPFWQLKIDLIGTRLILIWHPLGDMLNYDKLDWHLWASFKYKVDEACQTWRLAVFKALRVQSLESCKRLLWNGSREKIYHGCYKKLRRISRNEEACLL